MAEQVTLLTSHKGVDLHAATAWRVLRDRLGGGERLLALARAEFHAFWTGAQASDEAPPGVARLLATGRYFNPNKHRYGHFRLAGAGQPWPRRGAAGRAGMLPAGWPGVAVATDCGPTDAGLLDRLLGAAPAPAGGAVVDVCAFPLEEPGPLLSGVLWRLVLAPGAGDPLAFADELTVARAAGRGLLVNPHMQGWLVAARGTVAGPDAGGRQGRTHGR